VTDRLPAAPDRLPAPAAPLADDLTRLILLQEWTIDVGSNTGWHGLAMVNFHGFLVPWHPVGGSPDWSGTREQFRDACFRSWCEITDHFEAVGARWNDPPRFEFNWQRHHPLSSFTAIGYWRAQQGGAW
jgi:hypothetical protein